MILELLPDLVPTTNIFNVADEVVNVSCKSGRYLLI